MNIIFVPDYRSKNSYQTNLSNSLKKRGGSIYFSVSVPRSVIKYWRPDILHIHWTDPFMVANSRLMTVIESTRFIFELLMLKLLGVKIVWTIHNIKDHEGRYKSIQYFFTKILIKLCNRLIVHCQSAKEETIKVYGENSSIRIIPHGNYIGWYKNAINRPEAREKLNIRDEDIVFLYFGQIRSYKGVDELIDTFKVLEHPNVRLLIVGKPLNKEIGNSLFEKCKSDSRIKIISEFIPDEDIQIYMNAADIVTLPFKNILTSGSALLAMSFAKPIITPNIGCIKDTLDEKGSFLYNGDNDRDNLLEVLRLGSKARREILLDMGEHNFRLAEKLGWDEIGKKTYEVYFECFNYKEK